MAHTNNPHQADQAGAPSLSRAEITPAHQGAQKTRRSPRYARLLRSLIAANGQPIDCLELGRLVGAVNLPDLVMHAKRSLGVTITTSHRKHKDRDGRTVEVGQYAIVGDQAQAKAREVLATMASTKANE